MQCSTFIVTFLPASMLDLIPLESKILIQPNATTPELISDLAKLEENKPTIKRCEEMQTKW